MVVVQSAFTDCTRASRNGVVGQLAMVIFARKCRQRGNPSFCGFTFPSHIGARRDVFAPSERVQTFAHRVAIVCFKQTAWRFSVQIGLN